MFGSSGKTEVSSPRAYLLYDSRCGPCTRFMKIVKLFDLHSNLTPLSIHGDEAIKLVRGRLSSSRLKSSFHIVEISSAGSEVYSAGDGLVRLTRYAPAGKLLFAIVSRLKFIRQFLRWSYFQATRIRSSSKSCSVRGNISR